MSALFAIPSAIRIDYNFNDSLLGERVYWCVREFPEFFGSSRKTLNKIYAVYQWKKPWASLTFNWLSEKQFQLTSI
uniref:Transposase n=1 Tax=Ascaris lumbricoides TaxID=6252 RepID=A0A0M3IE60_ASCLU